MEEDGDADTNICRSLISSIVTEKSFRIHKKLGQMDVNKDEKKKIFNHHTKDNNQYETILRNE